MNTSEKKVVKESTYTIKFLVYDDGSYHLSRTCENFNVFELLGVLELIQRDLRDQFYNNSPKPDVITKQVIKKASTKSNKL